MQISLQSDLADKVRESISTAVQHVREIFATEYPTGTAADSIRILCAQTKILK